MRTKVTLVLLFLNVALFFFIFTFERSWRTERAFLEASRRVLGPEAANIQSLAITGGRFATAIKLEKRGDSWYLTQPLAWPANPNAVSRILNELQFMEHETSFTVRDLAKTGQTLADFGLAPPAMTVAFTSPRLAANGQPAAEVRYVLKIGDATKVGNRLYVLSPDGTRIHVVGRSLADSLNLTLDELRADTVFTIPVFEVRAFTLQTAAPANLKIRLRRDGARWTFESPIITRAGKTAVDLAINGLNALRVSSFLDPQAADADRTGLANPALRLTLDGNSRRETLLIGNPVSAAPDAPNAVPAAAGYYAKMEDKPPVFTLSLPAALLDTLKNAQETLRDPHVLDFDPRTVSALALSAPNYPELNLQRLEASALAPDATPWQIVLRSATQGPQTQPADPARIQRLLTQLTLLTAQKFVSDAPSAADLENYGFNRPERAITLTFAAPPAASLNGAPPETPPAVTLLLGAASEKEDRVYAKLANAPFVYLVDPDILRETPVVPRVYRNRLIRELPAGAKITSLTLTDLATHAVLLAAKTDATAPTWTAALAPEPAARRAVIETLLGQLRTLRAKDFVLDRFSAAAEVAGELRPWKYQLDATIALVGGADAQTSTTTTTLYFSERTGGGTQLVGSKEFNLVFEAEQPLLDALWALTYGPHDPGPVAAPPATAPAATHPPAVAAPASVSAPPPHA